MEGTEAPKDEIFSFQFHSQGNICRLDVPLKLPYQGDAREHATRLVRGHKIPFHLENDLYQALDAFTKDSTMKMLDQEVEESLYGGSVFEKGSETERSIVKWEKHLVENCAQFSAPNELSSTKSDEAFSDIYHKLIHSPALETLLQLEHTYAMAVAEVMKAWENACDIMQKRQDSDLERTMQALGSTKSEMDINLLMRQHTLERESCEQRWSSELNQLRESQRREYRDWVIKVYEDMESSDHKERKQSLLTPPKSRSVEPSTSPSSSDGILHSLNDEPPLEESYTVNLGAQKKMMHNVRIIRDNPLNFCRHKSRGMGDVGMGPNPERLQTAMSLYSSKLSAIVLMSDRRINSLAGLGEAFVKVCHQSTDFHFPDVDVQMGQIQDYSVIGNRGRQERDLNASFESRSGESLVSSDTKGNASSLGQRNRIDMAAGTGVWGGRETSPDKYSDNRNVSLEPGDIYITRHSNLCQVHTVFHLVTDESVIMNSSLKNRHPIFAGLKSCLRVATRHDIYHVTIPLLLVHSMQPEMTITWCLRRAEMVFKCVKGFMLETTAWSESDSRTIQFLVPPSLSVEVFEEFCDMLPKIFRVTSSRNLTSRTRTYSYR